MFTPDPSFQAVPAARDQLVALIEGINQPQVSIPGKPSQGVFGYLCGVRNANGTFSIYVALHLPKSAENVVYLPQRRQVTADEYREVQDEGLLFLESMGFMLDNLNYRSLAPAQQEATLQRVPVFAAPRPAAAPAEADGAGAEAARLARLLASF